MIVLGIESSADETGAAIVEDGHWLLANEVASSLKLHQKYGGIVPEIAARSHIEAILPTVQQAMKTASVNWYDIDAIAVTRGPGLLGSLLIGVMTARTLAIAKNKPLFGINHVEAHVYANFITDTKLPGYTLNAKAPSFPFLALIISGGHTQLVIFRDHGSYELLGQTADDAVGEAYDKVAKIIGLPYPGGVSIDKIAPSGNPHLLDLPKARLARGLDFSFSGPKTAVLRATQKLVGQDFRFPSGDLPALLTDKQRADIAASFQRSAIETLADATEAAVKETKPTALVLAGGVAASRKLRETLAERLDVPLLFPDINLCTDNAAMIATLGYFKARQKPADNPYKLQVDPSLSM